MRGIARWMRDWARRLPPAQASGRGPVSPPALRAAPHHLQVLELLVTEEPQLVQSLTLTGPGAAGGPGAGCAGAGPEADGVTLAPHFSQNLTPSRRA